MNRVIAVTLALTSYLMVPQLGRAQEKPKVVEPLFELPKEGDDRPVTQITFSHDGAKLAAVSRGGLLKVWDWKEKRCLQTFIFDERSLLRAAFDPTDKPVYVPLGASDRVERHREPAIDLYKCNMETGTMVIVCHVPKVNMVWAIWPDKNTIVCSGQEIDEVLPPDSKLWPQSLKLADFEGNVKTLLTHQPVISEHPEPALPFKEVRFSLDRKLAVVNDVNNKVIVLDLQSGKKVSSITVPERLVDYCLSADNKFLLTAQNKAELTAQKNAKLMVWDLATGMETSVLAVSDRDAIDRFAGFSSDGRIVAIWAGYRLHFFDWKSGTIFGSHRLRSNFTDRFSFSSDGTMYAIVHGGGVRFFEAPKLDK